MAFLVGAILALATFVLGRTSGLDRDRAFYSTVAIVVASYYSLFAVLGGSTRAIVAESLYAGAFAAAAVVGFRTSLWVVAAALAGHGVFDGFHGWIVANPGLPSWWPAFCGSFDVVAGAFMAWLLATGRLPAAIDRAR